MRTATNITVKRKRIGSNHNNIKLPNNGEIIKIDDEIFKTDDLKQYKDGKLNVGEFSLDTMDGCLRIKISIVSLKPFRTK